MTTSKGNNDINKAPKPFSHHILSRHSSDIMSTLVLSDSQGKYFGNLLEKHHTLRLFSSEEKDQGPFPKIQGCDSTT